MASVRQVATGASGITGVLVAIVTFAGTEYFASRRYVIDAKVERARMEIEVEIQNDRAEQVERLLDRQQAQFKLAFDQIARSCRQ